MISTRFQNIIRLSIAAVALAGIGFATLAASSVDAAGIRNCVDLTGRQFGQVGCYEYVWADDQQVRMIFSNQNFPGTSPHELDPFYVVAPQTATPQGAMAGFPHDHVTRSTPHDKAGPITVKLQGFFVFCTAEGLTTGDCVPHWMSTGGDPLPFAASVHGQPLRSAGAIEAAADAGLVSLMNLGPDAVIVGAIGGH
jgi:hypothetical protein